MSGAAIDIHLLYRRALADGGGVVGIEPIHRPPSSVMASPFTNDPALLNKPRCLLRPMTGSPMRFTELIPDFVVSSFAPEGPLQLQAGRRWSQPTDAAPRRSLVLRPADVLSVQLQVRCWFSRISSRPWR